MNARHERTAWLLMMGVIAAMAFRLPDGVTPTRQDLELLSPLVEIRRQIDQRYVEPIDRAALQEGAIAGLMSRLDQFSQYVPPSHAEEFNLAITGNFRGVGVLIDNTDERGGLLVIRPIPNSPAQEAGVRAGDRIVAVDGEDITALPQTQIVDRIKGPIGTNVTLTVERAVEDQTRRLELTMPRAEVAEPTIEGYTRLPDGTPVFWVDPEAPVKVGYVRLTRFTDKSAEKVGAVIRGLIDEGMQGLILDLRNNPGGLLEEATMLGDLFLEEGVIVSARGANYPERTARATAEGTLPPFPMVVLVDEGSASASEVLAGALQDHGRAVVVGQRTYGKGSVQDVIRLYNGAELKLTTAHYYLPSGRLVHRQPDADDWGVLPDVISGVDRTDPAQQGEPDGPPFPAQVQDAHEVLLGLVAARSQRPATAPAVPPIRQQTTTQPATLRS